MACMQQRTHYPVREQCACRNEVYTSWMMMHASMLKTSTVQDVKDKCKRDFLSAYAAELVFWPAFQAVNFWKVPVRHQLLAVNTACLLDATFLCWCGFHVHKAKHIAMSSAL